MKLIIFGSTGGTGRQLVTQALEQGHTVAAFTRHPEKFGQMHENLQLIKGDVLDLPSVEQAIQGQDVVLCALGTPAMNKQQLRANGTKNIIQAMEKTAVRRLICQSGFGCGDSHDELPFHYKYLIMPLMLRYVYADHEAQEKHIKQSHLDWTIARPGALGNGKHTGTYWHGSDTNRQAITLKISRADVADFMLRQLKDDTYLHQTPGVSYLKTHTERSHHEKLKSA